MYICPNCVCVCVYMCVWIYCNGRRLGLAQLGLARLVISPNQVQILLDYILFPSLRKKRGGNLFISSYRLNNRVSWAFRALGCCQCKRKKTLNSNLRRPVWRLCGGISLFFRNVCLVFYTTLCHYNQITCVTRLAVQWIVGPLRRQNRPDCPPFAYLCFMYFLKRVHFLWALLIRWKGAKWKEKGKR